MKFINGNSERMQNDIFPDSADFIRKADRERYFRQVREERMDKLAQFYTGNMR